MKSGECSEQVLIVDDDEDIRDTLKELLEDEGYEVACGANGREALDKLRAMQGQPCMIVLDLMMPVMDGWEFLREQRSDPALRDIPVCVITAAGPQPTSAVPVEEILHKPVRIERVLDVLEQYCDGR